MVLGVITDEQKAELKRLLQEWRDAKAAVEQVEQKIKSLIAELQSMESGTAQSPIYAEARRAPLILWLLGRKGGAVQFLVRNRAGAEYGFQVCLCVAVVHRLVQFDS